jgi:hypothetical protein
MKHTLRAPHAVALRWRTRTLHGVHLERIVTTDPWCWRAEIGTAWWYFYQSEARVWRAYTADHLTGARAPSLKKLVGWVVEHRAEWEAKLQVRRAAGTRMVDPSPAAQRRAARAVARAKAAAVTRTGPPTAPRD